MLKEFKEFAMRGNVLDMAVGIVVGGAFTREVNHLRRQWERPAPAAPTTKQCPFYISPIPLKARRCQQCTSALSPA